MALSPESTIELFDAGNYMTVAWEGHPDLWQTYAAMGLIGKTHTAIEKLSGFTEQDARFYSSVISWIEGEETPAIKGLEKIETEHARRLLALIRKPKIEVLAQLTWLRGTGHDLISGISHDPKFRVRNISYHKEDLPNRPYADVHTFYDQNTAPDFYVSTMMEWHLKPPNLQSLPCPIFAHTSDFDVHIQAMYPWLQIFDEVLTTGSEWFDLRNIVQGPVGVFPRAYGLPDGLPPIPEGPRDIDVFLSGTSLHAYHPDKARLYHQIMGMTDINLKILNGFLPQPAYYKLMGNAKVVFTYYRRDGGPLSRALESLAMGCAVVMQRGNMLELYTGPESGLAYYDFDKDTLVPTIRKVLADWERVGPQARKGAMEVRREFNINRVASQYFRFLTFLAAKPRGTRRRQILEKLDQKRHILWKGLLPASAPDMQKLREVNIQRWQNRPDIETSPHIINNIARELVLEYAAIDTNYQKMQGSLACEALMGKILDIFWSGVERFPRSLVLRFNLIRTALLFGQPHEVAKAVELGENTLTQDAAYWRIDVMEDVMPWDFCETYFNYRAYFDTVVQCLASGKQETRELLRIIMASLYHYLGHYANDSKYSEAACDLDPEFPFYRFYYARRLIQSGGAENYRVAGNMLTELARKSILVFEAFELLEQLKAQGIYESPYHTEIKTQIEHAKLSNSLIERQPYMLPLKPGHIITTDQSQRRTDIESVLHSNHPRMKLVQQS